MERFILIVRTELSEYICLGLIETYNPLRALIEGLRISEWLGWNNAEFFLENEEHAMQYVHNKDNCWLENTYAGIPAQTAYLTNHNAGCLIAIKMDDLSKLFVSDALPAPLVKKWNSPVLEVPCST